MLSLTVGKMALKRRAKVSNLEHGGTMGEARQRKAVDPNYGRVPKVPPKRGLVVSCPLRIEGTSIRIRQTALDQQELRFALLFWDQLAWPTSRAIHIANGPDEQFLQDAGVMFRPEFTFDGDGAQGLLRTYLQAFDELDKNEPGAWALSQGENSLLLADGRSIEGNGTTLELHRAIPIPAHDVPLQEILEFRNRRRDELLLLRQHLDGFMHGIENISQDDIAIRVREIDSACSDLLQVGREWQFPMHLSNLKATFGLNALKFLSAAGGGWKLAEPYGLTAATVTAAAAGLVSTLELKSDIGFRPVRRPKNPYRYVYSIDREL
jgi:hypothetical protein